MRALGTTKRSPFGVSRQSLEEVSRKLGFRCTGFPETWQKVEGVGAIWSWVRLFRDLALLLRRHAHAAGEVERTRQYDHEERQDPHLDEQDLTLFHTLGLMVEVGGEQ